METKLVKDVFKRVAVFVATQGTIIALDQTVRTVVNDFLKKRLEKKRVEE